jgi:MFS family permease
VPRIVQPLRHRDFRLLWLGQTLSLFGTFVSNIAYPFQILRLGGSPLDLGLGISIYTATNLTFLLLGGVVADRVTRRTLIIATELGSGIAISGVAVLGFAGALQIWHLYVAFVVFGAATAFSVPALGALVPELVPEDILVPGNAIRGLSRQIGRSGGPILGGLLVAIGGPPLAFAFDAVTFFGSAAFVGGTRARPLDTAPRASFLSEIGDGFAFVFSVQWLWVTIFGFALVNMALIGGSVVGLPILVAQIIGGGAAVYGLLVAATGVGEAIGAAVIGQFRIRWSGTVMYGAAFVSGVALAVYGLLPNLAGALAASVVYGISLTWFGVLWQSALQRHVPRNMLGRVTSVDWFGGTLLAPIAPVIAAFVIESAGAPALFVAAGVAVMLLTLGGLLLPSIRELE